MNDTYYKRANQIVESWDRDAGARMLESEIYELSLRIAAALRQAVQEERGCILELIPDQCSCDWRFPKLGPTPRPTGAAHNEWCPRYLGTAIRARSEEGK